MSEKLTTWVVLGFLAIAAIFTVAAIFMPGFIESGGATIVTVILGAFVSLLAGGAVGAGLTKQIKRDDSKNTSGTSGASGTSNHEEDGQ